MAELCAKCGKHPRAVRCRRPLKYRRDCRECMLAARQQYPSSKRKRNPTTVDEEYVPMLRVAPVREWLLAQKGDMDNQMIANLCRLDQSGVCKILNGTQVKTKLDTIDKILVGFGAPMMLGRLYPELYDDPSVFA